MKVNDTLVKDFLVVYRSLLGKPSLMWRKTLFYERNKNVDQSVMMLMATLPAHDWNGCTAIIKVLT